MVATRALSEHLASLALSPSRPISASTSASASPGPTSATHADAAAPAPDLGVDAAVTALVHHLTLPLAPHYPHAVLSSLRTALHARLVARCTPTWRTDDPSAGSGARSLICLRRTGLPRPLKDVAKAQGISPTTWIKALAKASKGRAAESAEEPKRKLDEWEAWCDPGMVAMRHGPWEWYDAEFDPVRSYREPIVTLWHAAPATSPAMANAESVSLTPARPNAAIPIRAPAPALFAIPPTPSHRSQVRGELPLMPAAHIGAFARTASFPSRTPSPTEDDPHCARAHPRHRGAGSGSTSSVSSSVSDSNSGTTQLLTPASRPGSADPYTLASRSLNREDNDVLAYVGKDTPSDVTATPTPARGRDPSPTLLGAKDKAVTPTVTPYDGGNVTVLGGGVKLGGASRTSSVISQHRIPLDRARSPSISLASRALNTALSPSDAAGNTSGRKPRTRRRIMPTYLGYVGQPGVGGPVSNAFQPSLGKIPQGQPGCAGQAQVPMGMMQGQGWMGQATRQPLQRLA